MLKFIHKPKDTVIGTGDYVFRHFGEVIISTHSITITQIANGTISADKVEAEAGETITLSSVGDTGYQLGRYIATSGGSSIEITDNTFIMPDGDVELTGSIFVPVKTSLINMTLGNAAPAAGTQNQYRILKVDGDVAEVVAMYDMSKSQKWHADTSNTITLGGLTVQDYSGCDLDIYLNSTFYNTLSDTAKAAIVDKAVKQRVWYNGSDGNPVYNGQYNNSGTLGSYSLSLHSNSGEAYENDCGNRHIYALDVQDIIDYLEVQPGASATESTLQPDKVLKMFWNTETPPSTVTYPWLRSANASDSGLAFRVYGGRAYVNYRRVNYASASRLAFKIDLSKITWSKV